jgi:hypothetical protein
MPTDRPSLLDRCIKVLTRRAYPAVFRLFGEEVDPSWVRFEDVALNIPEHRADGILVVETPNPKHRWALLLEAQTRPEPDALSDWHFKAGAARQVLRCPVILGVLYLERGEYATFPNEEVIRGGSLENRYGFETALLWEHQDRIANGDLPELAPLLLLASEEKTEAVLQQERKLILDLQVSSEQRRDLLAVATMVGTRYFTTETLRRIFREEMAMLKEAEFIQEWIDEGIAKGEALGEARGEARGEAKAYREALAIALEARFGPLSADILARLNELDSQQCVALMRRAVTVDSLAELGF